MRAVRLFFNQRKTKLTDTTHELRPGTLDIYTDGACDPNPGAGGFAAIILWLEDAGETIRQELVDGIDDTTNNQMELLAAIRALEFVKERKQPVRLFTDSEYVTKGMTEWLPGWKARGWKTSARKPVKNQALWQRLEAAREGQEIEWIWVRGHAGNEFNEQADKLAEAEAKRRTLRPAKAA